MAGTILITFGSLTAAVGIVLLVLFALVTGSASLPDWLAFDRGDASAGPRLVLLGIGLIALGLSQVVTGMAAMGPGRVWARPAGIGLALLGTAAATWAMWPGGATPSVQAAFLPVIAAYLFVVLALILAPGWFLRR